MGTRDYYLDEENAAIREAYKEYLKKVFRLSGVAEEEACRGCRGRDARGDRAGTQPVVEPSRCATWPHATTPCRAKSSRRPTTPWIGLLTTKRWVWATSTASSWRPPSAVAGANEVLKNAPPGRPALLPRIAVHQLRGFVPERRLPCRIVRLLRQGRMTGTPEPRARWKRAMSVPNGTLSEAVGEIYVARYFPRATRSA